MSDDNVIKIGRQSKRKAGDSTLHNHQQEEKSKELCCSFCGRSGDEVLKMVKGPGVNICSECTMIAVQYLILQDRMISSDAQKILDAFWHKKD